MMMRSRYSLVAVCVAALLCGVAAYDTTMGGHFSINNAPFFKHIAEPMDDLHMWTLPDHEVYHKFWTPENHKHIEMITNDIDTDGDGHVDATEVENWYKTHKPGFYNHLRDWVTHETVDHDHNYKLDFMEIETFSTHHDLNYMEKVLLFYRFDLNDDKELDEREYQAMCDDTADINEALEQAREKANEYTMLEHDANGDGRITVEDVVNDYDKHDGLCHKLNAAFNRLRYALSHSDEALQGQRMTEEGKMAENPLKDLKNYIKHREGLLAWAAAGKDVSDYTDEFTEYLSSAQAYKSDCDSEEMAQKMFRLTDENEDGIIDVDEWDRTYGTHHMPSIEDEAKARGAAVMKDMDGDGDGKLKISGELMGDNGEAIALHAAAEHFNGHFMRFAHDVHNDGKPHPIVGHLGTRDKVFAREKLFHDPVENNFAGMADPRFHPDDTSGMKQQNPYLEGQQKFAGGGLTKDYGVDREAVYFKSGIGHENRKEIMRAKKLQQQAKDFLERFEEAKKQEENKGGEQKQE